MHLYAGGSLVTLRNAVHTLETVQVAMGRTVVVIEAAVIPRLFKGKTT